MGRFNKGASTNLYYILSDCMFIIIAFLLSAVLSGMYRYTFKVGYVMLMLAFLVIYLLSGKCAQLYNVTTFFYADRFFRRVSSSFILATAVTSTLLFVGRAKVVNERFYIYFLVCSYMLLLFSAYFMRFIGKEHRKRNNRTLLIGNRNGYKQFVHYLEKSNMEVNIVGYVSIGVQSGKGYLGEIKNLENIIHKNAIDQIYIMTKQEKNVVEVQPYINLCVEMGITVRVVMNSYQAGSAQSYVSSVGTYPVITYHTVSLNAFSKGIKRTADIIGAIIGIVIFSPVMLVTGIAIKMESKGPVFFKQIRVGLNGRKFNMYKFRSMCESAESMKKDLLSKNKMEGGFMFKIPDDPRVTKVGKFIRKTSIDELPQFFNVLLGDMSLVGTRPPTLDEVARYERNHWRRISIKPGITGLWQVSGRSTITDFAEIVELDTEYIDKWNFFMDFKIMFQTVLMVFRQRGAY